MKCSHMLIRSFRLNSNSENHMFFSILMYVVCEHSTNIFIARLKLVRHVIISNGRLFFAGVRGGARIADDRVRVVPRARVVAFVPAGDRPTPRLLAAVRRRTRARTVGHSVSGPFSYRGIPRFRIITRVCIIVLVSSQPQNRNRGGYRARHVPRSPGYGRRGRRCRRLFRLCRTGRDCRRIVG